MQNDPMSRARFRRRASAGLVLLATCLLAATCSSGLRLDCPACAANALDTGCPFPKSGLSTLPPDPKLLILSGGGSHGAFGAGLLYGWGQQPSGPLARPEFTVVTGISTGALQATHAFLGNLDGELKQIFTQTSNNMVATANTNPLGSNALFSREPLKGMIDQYVTDARILEVAQETDRELFVGTVNLDTSQFCPWNLSEVARKAEAAGNGTPEQACYLDLYRDVVFAASGAPILAPPVPLDAEACKTGTPSNPKPALHVDGGARLRVFAEEFLATMTMTTPTLYVIVNGKLVLHPICISNWIGTIAQRTLDMVDKEAMLGSLVFLEKKFSGIGGNFRVAQVPDGYCLDFGPGDFTPTKMTALFEEGALWAKTLPWKTTTPTNRVAPWPTACPAALLRGCTQP